MFSESNILLFLFCLLPVALYSVFIFLFSPTLSIKFKTAFIYLYTGLLSVTLLQFIFFIFPHLHDKLFVNVEGGFELNGDMFQIYTPTLGTLLMFAFVQVALMEEISKWIAFKCAGYMRGTRKKNLDHPYAIMFYSALVSAAFSIVENIQYAQRAAYGDFGATTPENVLAIRAITSVIVHMACGLFMGYYIALAKNSSTVKRVFYNIIGIGAATFMHGLYDFNWFKPNTENDYYEIFKDFPVHISSAIIILFCIVIAFFMAWNLKSMKRGQVEKPKEEVTQK